MNQNIKAIHVRNYRSIEDTTVEDWGDLNVFIGKNNAGKSNLLSTISLSIAHLRAAQIVRPWRLPRPRDQFTDKDPTRFLQIGITFLLPAALNQSLREDLLQVAPQFRNSIDMLRTAV